MVSHIKGFNTGGGEKGEGEMGAFCDRDISADVRMHSTDYISLNEYRK